MFQNEVECLMMMKTQRQTTHYSLMKKLEQIGDPTQLSRSLKQQNEQRFKVYYQYAISVSLQNLNGLCFPVILASQVYPQQKHPT